MDYTILFAQDDNSYTTIWINGIKEWDATDNIRIEDILWRVSQLGRINSFVVNTYNLCDINVSDIPESVNTAETLCEWYLETTGEEIEEGW